MKQETEPFNFAHWLEELGHGATNRQASERLQEVVSACQLTGKKGKITISIDVGAAGGLAELRASISFKRPEAPLPGGTYYVADGGALVDEDPRQLSLPVPKKLETQPARVINVFTNHNPQPAADGTKES